MTLECTVGGHKYETEPLYFEDFTTLGFMAEEKIYPFLTCFFACIANDLSDSELLKALYNSCKDIFNREDLRFISNFIRMNLGNFTSLSALLPAEWTQNLLPRIENKLSTLFTSLNAQF